MPMRVAVVGLEPGTHWNGYIAAAQQSPEVELAAVALRPALAESLRDQLAGWHVPVYHDAATLLDREAVDVLALSTVPNEQAELLVEGLRRGLHVATDKPLVTTRDDLERVRRELGAHPELHISMLMSVRGDRQRQAARQLVHAGALGPLAMLHSRRAYAQRRETRPAWFFDEALSGGPWADGAIHGIDEVLWITGRSWREVVGYDANVSWPERMRFFDHGQALFRLDGDAVAIVEHHRLALNDCWLSILGTTGKIEVDRHNRAVLIDSEGERELSAVVELPPAVNVFSDFVESLIAGRPALVDTADVIATMEAVFAAREAARTGQRVVAGLPPLA